MSASCVRIHLRLLTLFCIFISTALSDQEKNLVIWKNTGEYITIQCKPTNGNNQLSIYLKKGIHKDFDIYFKSPNGEPKIADIFNGRMEINDNFPSMDILLKNLTSDDTGVYWCLYQKFDLDTSKPVQTEGKGSVLLVVTDPVVVTDKSTAQECDQPNKHLVVTSVVISSAVLLTIVLALLLLVIRKVKSFHAQDKPRPVPNNDVYEDMRGTIRR